MDAVINIDIPELTKGVMFYTKAFGLILMRRLGLRRLAAIGHCLQLLL